MVSQHQFSQWAGHVSKNEFNHRECGFKNRKWGPKETGNLTIKSNTIKMAGPGSRLFFFEKTLGCLMPIAFLPSLQRKANDLQHRGNFQSHLLSSGWHIAENLVCYDPLSEWASPRERWTLLEFQPVSSLWSPNLGNHPRSMNEFSQLYRWNPNEFWNTDMSGKYPMSISIIWYSELVDSIV